MYGNRKQSGVHYAEDEYTKLANAIVLRAARDYRVALYKLTKHPYDKIALLQKCQAEWFFHSDWFKMLTSIDPEILIEKLNEE